jgi:hypothetical protein
MIRAPITITFMLACHTSPEPAQRLGVDHWDSPIGREVRQWLIDNDLIDHDNRSTPKGRAWVEFIINTPLPVATWVLPPRGNGHVEEPEHDPPPPNLVKLMRSTPPWGAA